MANPTISAASTQRSRQSRDRQPTAAANTAIVTSSIVNGSQPVVSDNRVSVGNGRTAEGSAP